ncbi:hypothetical protein ACJJTC_009435 [Scirpophaga incertulas]
MPYSLYEGNSTRTLKPHTRREANHFSISELQRVRRKACDSRIGASVPLGRRRTLVELPIAELTNDELHGPLGPDEGPLAQRAVATDAIRPTHARTHTHIPHAQSTGTQKHAISIETRLGLAGYPLSPGLFDLAPYRIARRSSLAFHHVPISLATIDACINNLVEDIE